MIVEFMFWIVAMLGLFTGLAWIAEKWDNYVECTCRKGAIDPWCAKHGWKVSRGRGQA